MLMSELRKCGRTEGVSWEFLRASIDKVISDQEQLHLLIKNVNKNRLRMRNCS